MTDSLIDLFSDDPMSQPLTYPGRLPRTSGVLTDARFAPLRHLDGEPAGDWLLDEDGQEERLSDYLDSLSAEPLDARHRVIAVGSNAAPSQLYRKFTNHGVRPVIPLTLATVRGIAPGVSAHINRNGYIPAAPIIVPGEQSRLFVLWLNDQQLEVLDATEPNYHRQLLSGSEFPVRLISGISLPSCHVYVGKHGYLIDPSGAPMRLDAQPALILHLLSRSAELRRLCGASVEEFVSRVQDPAVRDSVYTLFRTEGLVHAFRPVPGPSLNHAAVPGFDGQAGQRSPLLPLAEE